MSRLIDADAIILPKGFFEEVDNVPKFYEWLSGQPTIDPVKHGRWVKRTDENCWWYECSECGDYPMKNVYGHEELSAYCPNCGAIMVEGEEDE